jgi:hypothetical protein
VGTLLYVAGIFLAGYRDLLQAGAFLLWAIAALSIAARSWRILHAGSQQLKDRAAEGAGVNQPI